MLIKNETKCVANGLWTLFFFFNFVLYNRSCSICTSVRALYATATATVSVFHFQLLLLFWGWGGFFSYFFLQVFSRLELSSLYPLSHVIFRFLALLGLHGPDLRCLSVLLLPFAISFSKGYCFNSSVLGREWETFETGAASLRSLSERSNMKRISLHTCLTAIGFSKF